MKREIDHFADSGKKVEQTAESAQNTSSCAHENDLIYRKMAIEALRKCQTYLFDERDPDKKIELRSAEWAIEDLPSAQPEIIRCKDCKYWREHKYAKETKRYIPFCGFSAIYTQADDYCSKAERRTDG